MHALRKTLERVGENLIGGRDEDAIGKGGKVLRSGKRQVFFAREVMEETALGESGSLADVLNARGGIALGANDIEGGIEDFGSGIVMRFNCCRHSIPTSWYKHTV